MSRDYAIPEKSKRWSLKKNLKKKKDQWRVFEEWKYLISNDGDGEAWVAPVEDQPPLSSQNPQVIEGRD